MGVGDQRHAPAAVPPVKARKPLFNKWKGNFFKKVNVELGALFSIIYIMDKGPGVA